MPLKIALLGLDDDVLALARAATDPRFEVAVVCMPSPPGEAARQVFPLALYEPKWEALLASKVDAVVVARSTDREVRADQLRKLVQAQVSLLLVTPTCEAIVGFEVDMIRRDTKCVVLPYLPGGKHPGIAQLAGYVKAQGESAIGKVEQLVFERQMANRGREDVLTQLAIDAGLARAIVGNLTKVSAMGVAAGEPSLANLSVHLSGPPGILVRWSVGPIEQAPLGRITLIGSSGKAVLTLPVDERSWRLDLSGQEQESRTWPDADGPAAALAELSLALAEREPGDAWLDACRDAEIAETAQRSALRGRTIELYQEEHSEQGTFKGVMSVGGCFMLSVGLVGLFVAFGIGGVQMLLRDPDVKVEASTWPMWLKLWPVYPFAIFLLLQLLQLVFRTGGKRKNAQP